MNDYPHLKLPFKVEGVIKLQQGRWGRETNELTLNNRGENRKYHGEYLGTSANSIVSNWDRKRNKLKESGVSIPNENDIPVFLKIDTKAFDIDSLVHWGIEVISEEEEGYIIGASLDKLKSFQEKVNQFLEQKGKYKDTAAKIWELITDDSWRITQLLKGELGTIWENINDENEYTVQLGVSCYVPNRKNYPNRNSFSSEGEFQLKVNEFKEHERSLLIERDLKQIRREEEIGKYAEIYSGEIIEIWDNEVDAIYFKIQISGKGLKDLVLTYQYLYEVKLDAIFLGESDALGEETDLTLKVLAPDENTTKVCVIDSGIQENHRLIEPAIDKINSRSYIDDDLSTADYVKQSGHGTKVAGAILFPYGIPKEGELKLETIIQNARILDKNCQIPLDKFEPNLMEQIVADFSGTKIFNLSVSEERAYKGTHMPALAASLDKISYEKDILFIIATGNLYHQSNSLSQPGIVEHFQLGNEYPIYLHEPESKIANPGISYFSLTVGSIAVGEYEDDDYISVANNMHVSPFSRTGHGMWGNLKPDVVEFGGNLVKNKNSEEVTIKEEVCPELVNSTLHGAKATGRDSYGTSFSTPKVSYIASKLMTEHPGKSANMYRALIVQSAKLPEHCFHSPTQADFKYYGYGIPNVDRALSNSNSRITFIQEGRVGPKKADIYRLKIPEEIRGEGKEYRVLVEVTLSFTAKTRLTRKGSHSYLSSWLEWQSSKYNESFNSFRNRTIEYLDENNGEGIDDGVNAIKWVIRENPAWTDNKINRNNSTVQKSWTFIEPHQFTDEFSLAVIGHFGWDKSLESDIPYALCVSFEVLDIKMDLYNILAEAQIELETEQEIEF